MVKFRDREQILAEHHKTDREKRNYFPISHRKDVRTDTLIRFEPVKESASYSKTTRKDETIGCYGQ